MPPSRYPAVQRDILGIVIAAMYSVTILIIMFAPLSSPLQAVRSQRIELCLQRDISTFRTTSPPLRKFSSLSCCYQLQTEASLIRKFDIVSCINYSSPSYYRSSAYKTPVLTTELRGSVPPLYPLAAAVSSETNFTRRVLEEDFIIIGDYKHLTA